MNGGLYFFSALNYLQICVLICRDETVSLNSKKRKKLSPHT